MSQPASTCPYCNAAIAFPGDWSPGRRIFCGRCGDSFTPLASPATNGHPSVIPSPIDQPTEALTIRRNRLVGATVLTGMALMAGLGMAYALYTAHIRRENDRRMVERPVRTFFPKAKTEEPSSQQSPLRLAALGYLPPKLNLLLALQVETLARDPSGREFLNQSIRIGPTEFKPIQVASWLGLPPDGIDHLALGLSTSDPLVPLGILIVRTREARPFDQVQKSLKGELIPGISRSHLFRIPLPNSNLQPTVLWIDEHTLALAVIPGHLDLVVEKPRPGLTNLSEDLQKLLNERIEPGSAVWAVGEVTPSTRKLLEGFSKQLNPQTLQNVLSMRSFAFGLQVASQVRLIATLRMENEAAAQKWLEWLSGPQQKVVLDGSNVLIQVSEDLTSLLKRLGRE